MVDPSPTAAMRPVPRSFPVDVGRLTRISVFSALAIAGRLAFLWAPNFALTYFIVFLAGVTDGKKAGAAVGLLAMTVTNLMFSGLHPVFLANGIAMALLGVLGGLLGPRLRRAVRVEEDRLDRSLDLALLGAAGLFGTFLFSVASDLVSFVLTFLLTPEGAVVGGRALLPLVLMGLVFNLLPAVANLVLFAILTPALLRVLDKAGHLPRQTSGHRMGRVRAAAEQTG